MFFLSRKGKMSTPGTSLAAGSQAAAAGASSAAGSQVQAADDVRELLLSSRNIIHVALKLIF